MAGKNTAIVLAAGQGKRMHSKIQKQFLEIQGYPVLYYSLRCFQESPLIQDIILVTGEDALSYCKEEIVKKYGFTKVSNVIAGGKERYDSVYAGLCACKDCRYVLIHDGARPFISERIINEGIKFAEIYGAAAPGVMPKDTIKVKNEKNFSVDTPNRANLVSIQTPQVFKFDEILECHEKIRYNGEMVTDDTMVVEKYGYSVYLYDGEYTNIKVTTPEDLILAERLI